MIRSGGLPGETVTTPKGRGKVLKKLGTRVRVSYDGGATGWVDAKDVGEDKEALRARAADELRKRGFVVADDSGAPAPAQPAAPDDAWRRAARKSKRRVQS